MTEQATAANQLTFRQDLYVGKYAPPPSPEEKNTIKTKGKRIVTEQEHCFIKGTVAPD
jgi:hypothetical protein